MAISKIEMRPEGSNDYADVLYPKTSIDVIDGLGDWSIATGVNSYVITEDGITTLVPGVRVTVKFTNASTGTCTLKINSLSAKSITKPGGGTINIKANGVYTLVYDGTAFQLQGEGGEYGNATASDVKVGKTIGTDGGIVTGTFTSDATIPNSDYMYQGVTAYARGDKLTGTMPIRTIGGTITAQGGSIGVPYGYTDGGTITASFPNLVAENIKSGVNVGGVVGNLISAEGTTYTVPVYDPTDYNHTVINYNTGYQGSGGLKADVSLTMKLSGTLAMCFDTAQSYAQFQVYKNGTLFYEFYPETSPATTTRDISVNSGDIIRCKLTLQVSYPSDYNTILLMFNYSLEGGVTLL